MSSFIRRLHPYTDKNLRVDIFLIPVLALAFFVLQMDRGNIATALTSTITTDLGVNTNAINVGTQLFSAGIVILEIPSNILLQKVGPRRWLSVQILAWGLVATFQAFISNYASYLATRLLLGLCEAGFIPGALYYLSTWYTRKETSLRVSFFFLGNIFAGGLTSLIGAGILTIKTWAGWRWVFLIEGIITLVVAVIFNLFIPPKVGDGRPLAAFGRWSYFTERESHIIRTRVLLDDPKKSEGEISIKLSDLMDTWRQKRIWLHCLVTLTIMAAYGGLTTYTPSIIKSLGFDMVKANAMASVPTFISMFVLLGFAWLSDRTGHRGPWILLIITWNLITWSCLSTLPLTASKWRKCSPSLSSTKQLLTPYRSLRRHRPLKSLRGQHARPQRLLALRQLHDTADALNLHGYDRHVREPSPDRWRADLPHRRRAKVSASIPRGFRARRGVVGAVFSAVCAVCSQQAEEEWWEGVLDVTHT